MNEDKLTPLQEAIEFDRKRKGIKQYTVGVTEEGKVYIQDDDFMEDARLYINGDFFDLEQEINYANRIAKKLNVTKCDCRECKPPTLHESRMILCPTCGNKRCPKATNHIYECTNSNDPGQKGSIY